MTKFIKTAPVTDVWRFCSASNGKWQWQHLTINHVLLTECNAIHDNYEDCVADAQKEGYVQVMASTKQMPRVRPYPWRDR